MHDKPFSPAAEQNKQAILGVLKQEFDNAKTILEIGSGSGQHTVFFSEKMPHLTWQASDKKNMLAGIQLWLDESPQDLLAAIELDVNKRWPPQTYDGAFAANIAHIMHWYEIEALFVGLGKTLEHGGKFCLYGPFNVNHQYTSASNEEFDGWLKRRDPESCIRDRDDLNELAMLNDLELSQEWEMPDNNKILCWQKK